jgi:predicted extracellular nuclease
VTLGTTGVELSYSPGRIAPTDPAFDDSRKPLVGEFTFNGHKLFVAVNHFKSKSGDDSLFGHSQPPVLYTEVQRKQQAQVVNEFVDDILALDPNANVIVLGDLNDFQFSESISDVLAADILTNLANTLPITEQYTYLYVGNSQVLDHILVSGNLFDNAYVGSDIVHVNAEFAYSSQRPSDHDPVVATFTLPHRIYLPLVMRQY